MQTLTATYSPDDNKLRLYSSTRLDAETYARVKAAGFAWAPKQDLFVAPMWTPARQDLLIELCGEIDDEDTSLCDRAEERADRFETLSDKRAVDAERAHAAVSEIAQNIPLGQPILVGHHSERHARKHAEKIERGMQRAVDAFETSQYWARRAKGAIAHAKYKELPAVRARRIKGIEADKRKAERSSNEAANFLRLWTLEGLTLDQARAIAGRCWLTVVKSNESNWTAYDVLRPDGDRYSTCPSWTVEQVQEVARRVYPATVAHYARWIAHYDNRLTYERAMLDEQGASQLLDKKPKPTLLPLINYRAPEGVRIENIYHRGEFVVHEQIEMTAAEYAKIHNDYKCTRKVGGTHRMRLAMRNGYKMYAVFLTDSKTHPIPDAAPKADDSAALAMVEAERIKRAARPAVEVNPAAEKFAQLKQSIKAGVRVVSAPQLFPTPVAIAERMAELADIKPGSRVLEPSAGTGRLLDAIAAAEPAAQVVAVEINATLCGQLDATGRAIICGDFLKTTPEILWGQFDRIVMNPPFGNAQDIAHIRHALQFLKPDGYLVALCAAGSRQRAAFEHLGEWEDLPPGTFANEGTGVNVALIVLNADALARVAA